jgi:hypothetical protein
MTAATAWIMVEECGTNLPFGMIGGWHANGSQVSSKQI